MIIDCNSCVDGLDSSGETCKLCGGEGTINLTDTNFNQITHGNMKNLTGIVWSNIITRLSDVEDKVDDVLDKCNDIFEKLNE